MVEKKSRCEGNFFSRDTLYILHPYKHTTEYTSKSNWQSAVLSIIHHLQLLLITYWTNDVKSAARCRLLNRWQKTWGKGLPPPQALRFSRKAGEGELEVRETGDEYARDHGNEAGKRLCYFGERKNKERNGETPLRTGKYFEWIIKQLLNSAFVGYEEFCRSRRVLSTEAEGRGG